VRPTRSTLAWRAVLRRRSAAAGSRRLQPSGLNLQELQVCYAEHNQPRLLLRHSASWPVAVAECGRRWASRPDRYALRVGSRVDEVKRDVRPASGKSRMP
jgi:hypothetical protein